MARGGRRAGTKGQAYPNRTDLRGAQLPVNAPRELPYGDRAKLIAAQRQVPMGPPPAATGATPPPAGGPSGPASPAGPLPGTLPFTGPTARPNEPVTAGLPIGPGPGPEVLGGAQAAGTQNVVGLLNSLAQAPGATADVQELARYASTHS
jgi:hypothetical protein